MLASNRFHFCFGFAPQPQEFLLVHYLAVKSAVTVNAPATASISYAIEPTGKWWRAVQEYATVQQIRPPTHVFDRPLWHFAHQADVWRMQTLLAEGGVYLDCDTLCLQPFREMLATELIPDHCEVVMGLQEAHKPGEGEAHGLCNAVMLAAPEARFLRTWYEMYRSFRGSRKAYWDEHSVVLPWRLHQEVLRGQRPRLVGSLRTVRSTCFFYPNFNHATQPFVAGGSIVNYAQSYCTHLWETMIPAQVQAVTPQRIASEDFAYAQLARQFIGNKEMEL